MSNEELRKIYNNKHMIIEDLPTPKTSSERAYFRKRIAVEYGILDEEAFDDEVMAECETATEEEKQIYYTLDSQLRSNRNYHDLSISLDDLAYPRTIKECMDYYDRLLVSDDCTLKNVILNDINYFEDLLNDGESYEDIYNYKCFNSFDDFLEYRYIALRIAYLKKEGYIS